MKPSIAGSKELGAYRIDKHGMFDKSELDKWIKSGRHQNKLLPLNNI